ncbi:TetR/AcrR family transcriptional regulator [Actinocorallia populi]|uniref:TetR/AcrR family transcriptional regulator n=1 Tax=Actinocorallia populi TaxID=2079200 RepID=UPI000D087574|nr:TetR/AcrR family transcriptional regulator [Actinocorallia populi]
MNSDDPRAQRTRTRLRAAILHLTTHHDPATLTMAAVARQAEINRATVYQHYPDLDTLLTDAMEEAVTRLAHAAALCPLDAPRDQTPPPLQELFDHVAANAALYQRMLGPQGSPRLITRLRTCLTDALTTRFTQGHRPPCHPHVPADTHAAYLAGALTGVITHWLTHTPTQPPHTVALAFWHLFRP